MKKLVFVAVFAILLAGLPVLAFAQSNRNDSEYYYINKHLEKIYPYRNGYVIQYRRGINSIDRAYIPMSWFTDTGSKGEIITLPKGVNWPSLTVYYKNGEFSHIRLYVHAQASHQTWGIIPQNVDIDDRFENIEEFRFRF